LAEGLTAGQAEAAEAFAAWLKAPYDGMPFVLSGYAGTGKTYLSRHLLQQVDDLGMCWTVVAPTHKAVGVLRQQLAWAALQPTWYPSTIHRLLRLKLKRQGDVERCEETEQTAASLENLGHTRLEVLVGSLIGPLVALPGLVWVGSPLVLAQHWGWLAVG